MPLRAGPVAYTVVDLGALTGGTAGVGNGISETGYVVGRYTDSSGNVHGFLYDGTIHDIGSSQYDFRANGVNAAGQVTGYYSVDNSGNAVSYLYDGTIHNIGGLGGSNTSAQAINSSGVIVGGSLNAGGVLHPFRYDGSMHDDIGTLGGTNAQALGINAAGVIVGDSQIAGDAAIHPFFWDGTIHDIGTFGGNFGDAIGINDAGLVVGRASYSNGDLHAFLYDGTLHDLGTLGGCSVAFDINSSGLAVGYSSFLPCNQNVLRAVRYSLTTGIEDLNNLIAPGSGWILYEAAAINDAGQIAGTGFINGEQHAIRLDPITAVPEPATLLLLSCALGLGWAAKHRKMF